MRRGATASKTWVSVREAEAKEATSILGVTGIEFWREPDGRLDASDPLMDRLQQTIREIRPSYIYSPHPAEMHPDHRTAARLVARVDTAASEVRTYEVWTPMTEMRISKTSVR